MYHLKKKILSKIFNDYGYKYYPKQFKYKILKEKKFKLSKKKICKNSYKTNIKLASKKYNVNCNSIWNLKKFSDRENFSSLHRWTWANKLVSKNKIQTNDINFIENSINNWCVKYYNKKIDRENIIFEPYNISERVSNYIILLKLKIIKKDEFVLNCLENQIYYLLENIEYYKYKKSNHALNNLRAIYLFSEFLDIKNLSNYSLKFIKFLIKEYIDNNAFFKFGSSNYQFIFTKWMADILLISQKDKKKNIEIIQSKFIKNYNCLIFLKQNFGKNISIPLIGNISPDLSAKWITNFFFKRDSNFFFKKFWKQFNLIKLSKIKLTKIKSNEWIKLNNKKFTVYHRNPKINGFDFNHSHNEFFNILLYHKGKPIIIDKGRENYTLTSLFRDLSSKVHNSFLLNNKGIFDEYLSYGSLTKLGLVNVKNCNYTVKMNTKNELQIISNNKKFHITRLIKLMNSKIIINDKLNLKKKINLKLRFNLNSIYKTKDYYVLRDSNTKLRMENLSNNPFRKSNKLVKIFDDYGKSVKRLSLVLDFEKNNKFEILTSLKI